MILEILAFLGGVLLVNAMLSNKQAKVIESHAGMDREDREYIRRKSLALLDPLSPISIEDTRRREAEKRIAKAFEDQQQQMETRAMKAHAADCPDPWTCTKCPCFKWEPDKIVGLPVTEKVKTKKERATKQ